jgi:hypothetical protein
LPALYRFGLPGICWLILITYALAFVGEIVIVSRLLELGVVRTIRGFLSATAAATAAMAGGMWAAGLFTAAPPTYVHIATGIGVAAAIYLALIVVLERRMLDEMRQLLASKKAA